MGILAESESSNAIVRFIEGFADNPWLLGIGIALATLTSEDLTCITAGILSAKGFIPFWGACFACSFGIWVGDSLLYMLGWIAGHTRKHWKRVDKIASPERIAKGQHLFETYGVRWVFITRFLPGMRLPSYVAAGVIGWSFRKFTIALAIAAILWTPLLVGLAYFARTIAIRSGSAHFWYCSTQSRTARPAK